MQTTETEEAARWLRRSYWAGALVDAVAWLGMAVPALYGPTLRFDRDFDRERYEFAYAMLTGAPLMAGWTVLLLWADRKPLERRGILPITIVPVVAGLMANDAQAVRAGRLSSLSVSPVRALQLGRVALFCYSLAKAQAAERALAESLGIRTGSPAWGDFPLPGVELGKEVLQRSHLFDGVLQPCLSHRFGELPPE